MGHPSPKYTAEFKQRAVELYRERGCTYAELAREPGCDAGSISTGSRGRTHSALGHLSPEEFEARNRKGAAKAA